MLDFSNARGYIDTQNERNLLLLESIYYFDVKALELSFDSNQDFFNCFFPFKMSLTSVLSNTIFKAIFTFVNFFFKVNKKKTVCKMELIH